MEEAIKIGDYIMQVEQMLERLSRDVDARLSNLSQPSDIQQLDAYIFEVNSFYYRSFHQQVFPVYRQFIQEEVTRLLNLSLQEDTLKQGILTSIKRYAQLYNQVKKLGATLDVSKEKAYQQILALNREQDRRSIELFYTMKQEHEHLQALALCSDQLSEILNDQELRSRLDRNPAQLAILQMLDGLDLHQPLVGAGFNSLLSYLRFCHNLVGQMQKEKNPASSNLHILREIQARTIDTGREKLPASLQRFFHSYLVERINTYLQPLEFYLRASDDDFYQKNLRLLSQFLEDVVVILEKGQHFVLAGHKTLLSQAFHGSQIPAGIMTRMKQGLRQTLSELASWEDQFAPPGEPDFIFFSQQSRQLLDQAALWLEEPVQSSALNRIGPISAQLHRANFGLQYLVRWLDFVKQEAGQRSELLTALLTVVNTLDAFLNLLGNIRADLERMLAPRNLGRLWKDYTIRVERFPLEKGKTFPTQYTHLLEKHSVEKRLSPLDENTILFEEGDLFVIRVDSEYDEEMPNLVISTKG